MATKAKKAAPRKSKATQAKAGAGPAVAARSKDAKKTFGRAAPKTVKPETVSASAKPAKSTTAKKPAGAKKPSVARRVIRKVASTATGAVSGAVAMAASVVGKGDRKAKPKSR